MTHLVQRIVASALGATVFAISLTVATTQDADADTPCTITGFSPPSVTVGLSPKVVTFRPTVSDCTLKGWSVEGGDYNFYTYDAAPQNTFSPSINSETAPMDVVVSTYTSDYEERVASFANAFVLKRNTGWDQFNASPEPVRKGAIITIKGRLRMADWEKKAYVGYASRTVAVEFRTKTSSYRQVKTAMTGSGGYLTTTVTAATDGYWRLRYGGNTIAGKSTVAGDFVDVR
jgi:hypothetical protein